MSQDEHQCRSWQPASLPPLVSVSSTTSVSSPRHTRKISLFSLLLYCLKFAKPCPGGKTSQQRKTKQGGNLNEAPKEGLRAWDGAQHNDCAH